MQLCIFLYFELLFGDLTLYYSSFSALFDYWRYQILLYICEQRLTNIRVLQFIAVVERYLVERVIVIIVKYYHRYCSNSVKKSFHRWRHRRLPCQPTEPRWPRNYVWNNKYGKLNPRHCWRLSPLFAKWLQYSRFCIHAAAFRWYCFYFGPSVIRRLQTVESLKVLNHKTVVSSRHRTGRRYNQERTRAGPLIFHGRYCK